MPPSGFESQLLKFSVSLRSWFTHITLSTIIYILGNSLSEEKYSS